MVRNKYKADDSVCVVSWTHTCVVDTLEHIEHAHSGSQPVSSVSRLIPDFQLTGAGVSGLSWALGSPPLSPAAPSVPENPEAHDRP